MKSANFGAAGIALLLLAGCGRGDNNPNQPSADERQALDNIANRLDAQEGTVDTSADSLVPAEGVPLEGNGTGANAAGPAGNQAAPANAASGNSANAAAPR